MQALRLTLNIIKLIQDYYESNQSGLNLFRYIQFFWLNTPTGNNTFPRENL